MKSVKLTIISILLILSAMISAEPPAGYAWELVPSMSDEFNGSFDTSKWAKNYQYWSGRKPALFETAAVTMGDGNMRITGDLLSNPSSGWTHQGGLVRSLNQAFESWSPYFECRMKANKTFLSSTFWLINERPIETGCNKRVTELDITETVGFNSSGASWINDMMRRMNSNTHSRDIPSGCSFQSGSEGNHAELGELSSENYHVYGCWWKSPTEILFYLDGNYVGTVTPAAPFTIDMYLRFVVESYDWNSPPADGGMNGSWADRTTYYDWVRTWELVDTPVCGDSGTVMDADISGPSGQPDCYVDIYDLRALADNWLDCTLPGRAGCDITVPWDIEVKPSSTASIVIDGQISDWAAVQWHDANEERGSGTDDLSNAQIAFLWDDVEEALYLAGRVDDAALALSATAGTWDQWDSFEIACKGDGIASDDTSWKDSLTYAEAQQWRWGAIPAGGAWLSSPVTVHPGTVEQSASVSGNTLYYEAKIKQYSFYDKNSAANSVLADLTVGAEVLCYIDFMSGKTAPSNGPYWHGLPEGRVHNVPSSWARLRLVDADGNDGAVCGDYGYPDVDIVPDCVVDMKDWCEIAAKWLACTEPTDENCEMIE